LDSIGFNWGRRYGEDVWEEKFNELWQFWQQHKHCKVHTRTPLGRWVTAQRSEYKKLLQQDKTTMTSEKKRRLDNIGFVWFAQAANSISETD